MTSSGEGIPPFIKVQPPPTGSTIGAFKDIGKTIWGAIYDGLLLKGTPSIASHPIVSVLVVPWP
jgi:hypothetical protein